MRYFISVLIVAAVLLAAGYFYLNRRPPPATGPVAGAAATSPAAAGSSGTTPKRDRSALDREAQAYVRELSELQTRPVPADNADNFVQPGQRIKLLGPAVTEQTTPRQLLAEGKDNPNAPLTIVQEVERVEMVTPAKLLQRAGSNLNQPVRVLENGKVRDTTVARLVEQYPDRPDAPITIIRNVPETRTTTVKEMQADQSLDLDKPIKVIRGHQGLASATVGELLMTSPEADKDSIYYVRTVRSTDTQGIWGILQSGLTDNFARGMAIKRGDNVNTYKIDIPRTADELLANHSSSFLGKLLYGKTRETHVYNLELGRMGEDANLIHPGQELVIIRFTSDELIAIYKHFAGGGKA